MNNVIKKIYRNKSLEDIQEKINMIGSNTKIKYNAAMFITVRIISTILVALFLIFVTHTRYIYIPFILIAYYYLFYYIFITDKINKRIKKLDREALTFFEILTLTLESGRNLENSIEIAATNVHSELSDEFKRALVEVKLGKSLMEALEDMKARIPSETINNIVLNITQTEVFGNNILQTMYNQIEFLREKEILEIKGQINKIPNKISIISVLFILPLILLIILGPYLIKFLSGQ